MAKQVTSNTFSDSSVLFANQAAANTWRTSLQVESSTTASEGVAKQCTYIAPITAINSVNLESSIAGSNADNQTAIAGIGAAYNDDEIIAAFQVLAEKINYLTYRLEQAGLMADS